MLFDGICHLCNGSVRFIVKRDPQGKIKFAPIQSPLGSALYAQHGLDPTAPSAMLFITPRGAFQASEAALEIARTLGGMWKFALVFKLLPRALRDAAYYIIARNRYRWFGKDESCMMPTKELSDRLVET